MFEVIFTPTAKRDLEKLPKDIRVRIIKKLKYFASQDNPLLFSKPLVDLPPATHRFRVGNYRVTFYITQESLHVEGIGHRREIYK